MKKLLILFCLIVCLLCTGCTPQIIDENGIKRNKEFGLVEIRNIGSDAQRGIICYDPETYICYLRIEGHSLCGLSPYYIIGEEGQPEIAIYGVNYK